MKFSWFKKKKSHLDYTSWASWFYGESVPKEFVLEYGSGRRPDYKVYMNQSCELRQHLFDKHLKTLPAEIQQQLKNGLHPSQTHSKIKQAEPVLQRLKDLLSGLDYLNDISIKRAQMDLVQLKVTLKNEPTLAQEERIPEYFEGYVVNMVWIHDC